MEKYLIFLVLSLTISNGLNAQTIKGSLAQYSNQIIRLEGFNGLRTYPISSTFIDANGNFKLNYTKLDYGMGCLLSTDEKPFFVILNKEDTEIKGGALSYPESMFILKGQENQLFGQYAHEYPKREQVLSAWMYLEKIYALDSLFVLQHTAKQAIQEEKERIRAEDEAFLESLPKGSYVSWYLPKRKLLSSVSTVVQYRTNEISETIKAFRNIDYTDPRLYKSGLLRDAIESHFWLLENRGRTIDSVYFEMRLSIDAMFEKLVMDETKLNEITDYLFDLLERHSLFEASEYLSLKVLTEVSCTIDHDLAKRLETYRSMKKGNTAPDIVFKGKQFGPGYSPTNFPNSLSSINSKFIVIVFGASWCPKCTEDLPEIARFYTKWKTQGVEVVFVSLDDDKETYNQFVTDFPFISTCDYKKWESDIVNDYYVFATPTMFVLDSKRQILLRPNSVKQIDAWVDWYLVNGNE